MCSSLQEAQFGEHIGVVCRGGWGGWAASADVRGWGRWRGHNGGSDEQVGSMGVPEEEVYKMYSEAVDEEKAWARYLFKEGSMIGLSEALLSNYVECLSISIDFV